MWSKTLQWKCKPNTHPKTMWVLFMRVQGHLCSFRTFVKCSGSQKTKTITSSTKWKCEYRSLWSTFAKWNPDTHFYGHLLLFWRTASEQKVMEKAGHDAATHHVSWRKQGAFQVQSDHARVLLTLLSHSRSNDLPLALWTTTQMILHLDTWLFRNLYSNEASMS